MACKLYVGINNIAEQVKKIYVGVNNVAQQVKKVYCGDANGVAQLIWSGVGTLPTDTYQQVEYLSSYTQNTNYRAYIETDIYPKSGETIVEVTFLIPIVPSSYFGTNNYLYGSTSGNTVTAFGLNIYNSNRARFYYRGQYVNGGSLSDNIQYNAIFNTVNCTVTLNGTEYDMDSEYNTVNSTVPLYIYSAKSGASSSSPSQHCVAQLYKFKVWSGTELIRNFYPCYRRSDNVAGLFDIVNQVFYTNNGTGEFAVGPDYEAEL